MEGICPQITQIHADTESKIEQEETERTEFLSVSSVPSCSKNLHLRPSASICPRLWRTLLCCSNLQFRIRLRLAGLGHPW